MTTYLKTLHNTHDADPFSKTGVTTACFQFCGISRINVNSGLVITVLLSCPPMSRIGSEGIHLDY